MIKPAVLVTAYCGVPPYTSQHGLISYMAAHGADVEVLAVSDDDCGGSGAVDAVPLRQQSRRRGDILAAYRRLGVPDVRRHRLGLESGAFSSANPT